MAFSLNKVYWIVGIAMLSLSVSGFVVFFDISGIFTTGSLPVLETLIVLSMCIAMFVAFSMNKEISKVLLTGLFIRMVLALLIGYFGVLPYAFDSFWDETSNQMLNDWSIGNYYFDMDTSMNVKFYTYINLFVYYFLGYNPVFMQLVNVLFGVLTILIVYRLANVMFDKKIAKKSAWLMALFPSHIMLSAMNMRDALSTLLLSAFIYQFAKLYVHAKNKNFFVVILLFVLNILIRAQNALLLLIVTVPFLFKTMLKKAHPALKPLVPMVAITFILVVLGVLYAQGFLQYASFDYISREMSYRSNGGSEYLSWMRYHNIIDIVIYSPLRFLYFMFSPFPWEITKGSQLIAAMENILLWVMTFSIIKNWKKVKERASNKKLLSAIVIIFIVGIMANAMVDGNSGTALRHKLQYIYILIILYGASSGKTK